MTSRLNTIIRSLTLVAGIPFLYFVITRKEPNWLYYLSLSLILASSVYALYADWQEGKKAQVKKRAVLYALLLLIAAAVSLFGK